jgi:protein gp37
MAEKTGIQWTDHTFNIVWGCQEVSPGCAHCYARTLSERWGHRVWGAAAPRRRFDTKHWEAPLRWNDQAALAGVRRRVFTSSMADVFEDHPFLPTEQEKLWMLISQTPWLDWQILTKRPEHIQQMIPANWLKEWPANVWLGTSTENAEQAALRLVWLIALREQVKIPVVFVSAEPLLGPIDFTALSALTPARVAQLLRGTHDKTRAADLAVAWASLWNIYKSRYGNGQSIDALTHHMIDWVIVGGESGPWFRPMDLHWARQLRAQCQEHQVAYFFKQVGGRTSKAGGSFLDGQVWTEFPGTTVP